jgi:hypothetical protein
MIWEHCRRLMISNLPWPSQDFPLLGVSVVQGDGLGTKGFGVGNGITCCHIYFRNFLGLSYCRLMGDTLVGRVGYVEE